MQFLAGSKDATVLDPACGGGSFLVPIARLLVTTDIERGMTPHRACERSFSRLRGIEIDPGLATLSERLLRGMLRREHSFKGKRMPKVVRRGDSLTLKVRDRRSEEQTYELQSLMR